MHRWPDFCAKQIHISFRDILTRFGVADKANKNKMLSIRDLRFMSYDKQESLIKMMVLALSMIAG